MDLFKSLISTFNRKSVRKHNVTFIKTIKHTEKLKQLVDKTDDIIQCNINVEKVTSEINDTNVKDTENPDTKEIKENLHETSFDNSIGDVIKYSSNLRMIRLLNRNNTNVTIVNAKNEHSLVTTKIGVVKQSKVAKVQSELGNSSCENNLITKTSFNLENENDIETIDDNNASKDAITEFDNGPIKVNEVNNNITDSVVSKNSNNTQNVEDTTKCVKEFEDILAEVKGLDSSEVKGYDGEIISLDDFEDFFDKCEDLDDTFGFQEIKYENETQVIDSPNIDHILVTDIATNAGPTSVMTAFNVTGVDNTDVISISSDGTPNTEVALSENKNSPSKKNAAENVSTTNLRTQIADKVIENKPNVVTINDSEDESEDDDTGYHSSDFEFITEREAEMDGLIINFKPKTVNSEAELSSAAKADGNRVSNYHYGAGHSRNVQFCHKRDNAMQNENDKENYALPQENQFLNMFHEIIPGVPNCEIRFLENKSIMTRAPMLVQYDGIGFDMNLGLHWAQSSDEEYRDEAKETVNKIVAMYPEQNTKRKRRRRY